jgi:hypothetical protein
MTRVAALLVVAASLLLPTTATAGGFAPPKGTVWAKIEGSYWRANKRFAGIFDRDPGAVRVGQRVNFDSATGGSLRVSSLALSLVVVPIERLTVGAYWPALQSATFEDDTFIATTTGVGDLRPSLSYQMTPSTSKIGTTVGLDLKIPLSPLPVDFDNIPLSEGQWDVALRHETTWAAHHRIHLDLLTLLRVRTVFRDGARRLKPGDEFEAALRVTAAPWKPLWLNVGVGALLSTGGEERSGSGAITLIDRRRVMDARAGAYLDVGEVGAALTGFGIDLWGRMPFYGEDYPAGSSFGAGIAFGRTIK